MLEVQRSTFNYWVSRERKINPKKVKELAEVKRVHGWSKGSAGARTIASILTAEGLPMTRYVAGQRMKELELVSCQLPAHSYKKTGNEHLSIPNLLSREFTVDRPNKVWCGDVTFI